MRREFTAAVEDKARERAQGRCEECGGMLKPGRSHVDHIRPCALGGDNSLENARVLCIVCHLAKTLEQDMPAIRKADRKGKLTRGLEVAAGVPEIARRFSSPAGVPSPPAASEGSEVHSRPDPSAFIETPR